jgi:hypothetical protein
MEADKDGNEHYYVDATADETNELVPIKLPTSTAIKKT